MPNTSATGGFLQPSSSTPLPDGKTLIQFFQAYLVGLSGIDGTLVRPKNQKNPPKSPDIDVNWIAFWITTIPADQNAYVGMDADENTVFQRQVQYQIQCSFYGPDASNYAGLVRDNLQIQQNLEPLRAVGMGYASIDAQQLVPDLLNERWVNRIEQAFYVRHQINRVYPILSLEDANGTIHGNGPTNEETNIEFQTPAAPEEGES